ncbi:CvpA family protein [Pseudoflavonifractor hominis]|uniref:CvpA family protein n=1 Tax=Pseudoflavonifractor hominis TaxID=2763059 RepID=A0ABR7HP88_9FIRM|nr:CvpA family protein [Pseudoflavonifractor hominis]MBC5729307.1 CvpA family protein [Pseudoflavonifractor hominis]
MPYLLDLIVVAVAALFIWKGWRKGLVLSLCGLLAVLVAFAGAGIAARTLSPAVGQALEPKISQLIEERLEEGLSAPPPAEEVSAGEDPLSDVLSVLKDLGLYENLVDSLQHTVEEGMNGAVSAAASAGAAMAQSIAYRIIFLVSFTLILALWGWLSRALNLVARLPGLHFLNKTGGAAIGLVKALLVLFLVTWLLQSLGHFVPEETVAQTTLLRALVEHNPLTALTDLAV